MFNKAEAGDIGFPLDVTHGNSHTLRHTNSEDKSRLSAPKDQSILVFFFFLLQLISFAAEGSLARSIIVFGEGDDTRARTKQFSR